jgi:hypothetical protein
MIVAVTGFVPIPGHPRPEAEYRALGERLHMGLHMGRMPLFKLEGELSDCWLSDYLWMNTDLDGFDHAVADNPRKNSVQYHIVQAQKIECLAQVMERFALSPAAQVIERLGLTPNDVMCWIDFGIFHIPGVTEQIIRDFLQRAANERAIAIPGCWDKQPNHDDRQPNWRFCGGVVVVPCRYVRKLDSAVKTEYMRCLKEDKLLTWEVNILARVENRYPELPIWQYRADDHDASMFTNYPRTEDADGREKQGAPLRELEERPC